MPNAGDTFIVELKRSHLEWGTHRYTNTRNRIYGEGYLPIPRPHARSLSIFNSNHRSGGYICSCTSADGYLRDVTLKATGCNERGDVYAKQFQGRGNLRLLGEWFNAIGAAVGDCIRITWTSPTNIFIEKI
mgnify:CR=1 FL=1|jgi:hypothetical protein